MPQQRIKLDPDPPAQGQDVTICYDFSGSGVTQTTLRVTYPPDTTKTDLVVTEESSCATTTVPDGALQILIEDVAGPSPDKIAPVTPS